MQLWLGCSPEFLDSAAPSFRLKPAAILLEQSLKSPVSLCISLFLFAGPFHSRGSPLDSTPKLGKALFNIFIILLACFVWVSQDLSSSPSLERADSGLSERSVSLLSVSQTEQRATGLRDRDGHREVVREKKYLCSESLINLIQSQPQSDSPLCSSGMHTRFCQIARGNRRGE